MGITKSQQKKASGGHVHEMEVVQICLTRGGGRNHGGNYWLGHGLLNGGGEGVQVLIVGIGVDVAVAMRMIRIVGGVQVLQVCKQKR